MSKEQATLQTLNDDEEENEAVVLSLQDVIENTEVASAVLAASDPANCSYNQGYVYRQALYACLTCLKDNLKTEQKTEENAYLETDESLLHAICLGCTYECHQNHEFIELYTKRNIRCDCGNSKFKSNSVCKLEANKDPVNELNKYNHNFKGLYCTCNRPYPELGNESELNTSKASKSTEENSEEMQQCTICEDWFHLNHLLGNEKFPTNEEDYEDVICHNCMDSNQFLWNYQGYIALKTQSESKDEEAVDVTTTETTTSQQTKSKDTPTECFLKKFQELAEKEERSKEACCFLAGWREALCRCNTCLDMYKEEKIDFLLNPNDTIKYYEDQGKKNEETRANDENKLLDDHISKMNRVSQIEFLHSVKDFKEDLTHFLTNFAASGQVIKRENVVQFFDDLKEKKKRKLEDGQSAPSYFCK